MNKKKVKKGKEQTRGIKRKLTKKKSKKRKKKGPREQSHILCHVPKPTLGV